MNTEPVRAFAVRLKEGGYSGTYNGIPHLWTPEDKPIPCRGDTLIPVLILPDDPASRAVREAEQRVLDGIFAVRECRMMPGEFQALCRALLAARQAQEKAGG